MDLEQFRIKRGFTYHQLAEFLGISMNKAFRICKKGADLNLKTAYQITMKTGGAVSYLDLLTPMEGGS